MFMHATKMSAEQGLVSCVKVNFPEIERIFWELAVRTSEDEK